MPDETKDEFLARCIPMVIEEGASQDEAVGKCAGIWTNKKVKKIQWENLLRLLMAIEEDETEESPASSLHM